MVATELRISVDHVLQTDIDAAMLEALADLDEPVDSKPVIAKKATKPKSDKITKVNTKAKVAKPKATKTSAKKDGTIDRLKSYIAKCGVRRVWKKELDGLSQPQIITKLEGILRDLGMEGRPTLEKCAKIKRRREYEEEMREIDSRNIIGSRLRYSHSQEDAAPVANKPKASTMVIDSDEDEEEEEEAESVVSESEIEYSDTDDEVEDDDTNESDDDD